MKWLNSILRYGVLCLIGAANIWPFAADAAGYVSQSAWLEDKSGALEFTQVEERRQAFESFEGVLTRGYTDSTFWIRLSIAPTTEEKLILRIRPAYIDHIELFDPLMKSGGKVTPLFSGERFSRQQNDYLSLNHGFKIQGGEHPRDIYLRVQNVSTMLLYAEVLTVTQSNYANHRQELIYSVYLGLLTAFLFWALLQWLSCRDRLIAVFCVKQVVVLAHAFVMLSYFHLLFADSLSGATIVTVRCLLVVSNILVGVIFLLFLLREFKPIRWLWLILVDILFIYVFIAVLILQGELRLALQINIYIVMIESIGICIVAISARAWKDKQSLVVPLLSKWILVSFNVALVFVAFIVALPSLGHVGGAEWTLNAPVFSGFFNALLGTTVLSIRSLKLERNRLRTLLDLGKAEAEAGKQQIRQEEQERFLAMLTHELKTPLGVALISLGASKLRGPQRTSIERALNNINAVVDRCRMTDQFDHQQVLPKCETFDLMALIDRCIADCSDPKRVKVWERNLVLIQSDSQLIAICIANLIDNALKYSPPSSRVTVFFIQNPHASFDEVVVSVLNQVGVVGVPDAEKIFSKYYRSQGARCKSGSGLGLYLSSSIARLLGGELSHRVEGQQVEFRLCVPV